MKILTDLTYDLYPTSDNKHGYVLAVLKGETEEQEQTSILMDLDSAIKFTTDMKDLVDLLKKKYPE